MSNAQYLASLVNSSGNIVLPVANAGIVFNNTNTTASPTSTTQNDYETGTWTPVLSFGGSSTGITYTGQYGSYTKIGNLVTVRCYIYVSSKGTATGASAITTLPFAPTNLGQLYSSVSFYVSNLITIGSGNQIELNINNTSVNINYVVASSGADAAYNNTSFNSSGSIWFTATYQATF